MSYKLILFDADGTLFDYNKSEEFALQSSLQSYNINYNKNYHLKLYREIDNIIWNDYQNNQIESSQLAVERVKMFFKKINFKINPQDFIDTYLDYFSKTQFLITEADYVLKRLYKKFRLMIVTNGIKKIQKQRIGNSSIFQYFEAMITSEDAGISKPDPGFFNYAFEIIKYNDKKNTLIIGDSPESDIMGGINYGIDTCWYNPNEDKSEIKANYTIKKLSEILNILN